ncbi:MAG: hypothetical protein J7621_06780 [Niastella sp.]|nr:hypothetical protein [Niastella sp.]
MSNKNVSLQYNDIDKALQKYRSTVKSGIVKEKKLEEFRKDLQSFDHHEQWYFEMDLVSQSITWSYAFEKWLGYQDEEPKGKPLDYITRYMHPFVADWYKCFFRAMILFFTQKEGVVHLKPRFVINIPLLHADGHYLLVKQMIMPFGINEDKKVVRFISSFSIFDEFQGEPLRPRIYGVDLKPDDQAWLTIRQTVFSCIKAAKNFKWNLDPYLINVLDSIQHLKKQGVKITDTAIEDHYLQLSKKDGLSQGTMHKFFARIIKQVMDLMNNANLTEKDKHLFPDVFYAAQARKKGNQEKGDQKRAIKFFYESGIIGVMLHHHSIIRQDQKQ